MSSYIFVNGAETYKFKAKDSKIYPGLLCLGNVSKNFEGNSDTIDDPYARGLDKVKNMIVKVHVIQKYYLKKIEKQILLLWVLESSFAYIL